MIGPEGPFGPARIRVPDPVRPGSRGPVPIWNPVPDPVRPGWSMLALPALVPVCSSLFQSFPVCFPVSSSLAGRIAVSSSVLSYRPPSSCSRSSVFQFVGLGLGPETRKRGGGGGGAPGLHVPVVPVNLPVPVRGLTGTGTGVFRYRYGPVRSF